jgi:hypothetical protein
MSTTICKRCHRLKVVNAGGYCVGCSGVLRRQERRRPVQDAAAATVLAPSLAQPSAPAPSLEDSLAPERHEDGPAPQAFFPPVLGEEEVTDI